MKERVWNLLQRVSSKHAVSLDVIQRQPGVCGSHLELKRIIIFEPETAFLYESTFLA